ncbi:MAG: DUF3604 domain-containing protein [Myxococcota bacterium]
MLRSVLRWGLGIAVVGAVVVLALFVVAGEGWFGSHEGPGTIRGGRVAPALVEARGRASFDAARGIGVAQPKQILFGDLHVHTTVSFDAFMTSVPMLGGEGTHPQADACDFARHCSALDFWSINDHAAAITRRNWRETVESIRACNAIAGDPASPDTVAFLGWEWTQVGTTPEDHWGHKNVVLRGLDDDAIPSRPIAARTVAELNLEMAPSVWRRGALSLFGGHDRYDDVARYFAERADAALCDPATPVREQPPGCIETAADPHELFAKLDDWGVDSIVIPHGTTWGMYTPAASDWKKQITPAQHDPARQTLIEIYSGHGNSEEYRTWREVDVQADGSVRCPEARPDYLPRCQRAGEIVRERCMEDGGDASECDARAAEARQLAADAGGQAHLTVPGYDPSEWLDAGQCRDCSVPAFNYRPGGAAQYVLALSHFEPAPAGGAPAAPPLRARMGFIASSDNHKARPGTGFKEVRREAFTESRSNPRPEGLLAGVFRRPETARASRAVPFDRATTSLRGFQLFEMERQASYFMTGGLVAVHADGRDRDAIWEAFERREVYGTTGPRILLWFELLNAPGSRGRALPMGGAVELDAPPIFQARAVGSFEQEPGCPDEAFEALGEDGVARVCGGECYFPSDERRRITRIEVVRVRPQATPDEPVAPLIEDPWRVFECEPDDAGCSVVFTDPDYVRGRRDAVYYVRAIEEPTPTINAGGVRCARDAEGACTGVDLCGLDGNASDDCLAPAEPKAWSSPIYVDWPRG